MKVYFDQNFWGSKRVAELEPDQGECGEERRLGKSFWYGGYEWKIPSIYQFRKGFVLDFCRRIPSDTLSAFMEKWQDYEEKEEQLTDSQRRQMELENPMNFDVRFEVEADGYPAPMSSGCGTGYDPKKQKREKKEHQNQAVLVLPEGLSEESMEIEDELLQAYDLNPEDGWWFERCSFFWPEGREGEGFSQLRLTITAGRVQLPCDAIVSAEVNCREFSVPFEHPETHETHQIRILECKEHREELKEGENRPKLRFLQEYRFPEYLCILSYQVEPPLPEGEVLILQDCLSSDSPIQIAKEHSRKKGACAISMIGGSDGPTAIFFAGNVKGKEGRQKGEREIPQQEALVQTAYSALHFQPVSGAEWQVLVQKAPFPAASFLLVP
ncbi:MAG: hypothetical protein Q4E86_06045 [Lachnospiraceae bacterium]|nr:hypothetical protein [Lachnospiraceae bacterium]